MSIFTRKPKAQPIVTTINNEETVVMPVPQTEILPTVLTVAPQPEPEQPENVKTVQPELLQICANPSCKMIGATHLIHSGDFYLGSVDWYLCDACHRERIRKHVVHITAQKKTRIETPAVKPLAKGGIVEPRGMIIFGDGSPETLYPPQNAKISATVKQPADSNVKVKILLDGQVIGESA